MIIFIFFSVFHAQAANLRDWMAIKDLRTATLLRAKEQKTAVLRSACEMQADSRTIPTACFAIAAESSNVEKKRQLILAEQLCAHTRLEEVNADVNPAILLRLPADSKCYRRVREKQLILAYQRDLAPEGPGFTGSNLEMDLRPKGPRTKSLGRKGVWRHELSKSEGAKRIRNPRTAWTRTDGSRLSGSALGSKGRVESGSGS